MYLTFPVSAPTTQQQVCPSASDGSDFGPFSKHLHAAYFNAPPLPLSFPPAWNTFPPLSCRDFVHCLKPRSVAPTFTMISQTIPFRSDSFLVWAVGCSVRIRVLWSRVYFFKFRTILWRWPGTKHCPKHPLALERFGPMYLVDVLWTFLALDF